jgi:hypothetical protein
MAMRTASPWWTSLIFGVGLFFLFLGERLFGYGGGRWPLDVIGLILLLGPTALRLYTTISTTGARRYVERTLLACHLGVIVSLILYVLSSKWGLSHFHVTDKGAAKMETVLTVLYSVGIVVSLIPMFMIELSLGTALRTGIELKRSGDDEAIEYMRVADVGWSGLSVALALGFLMVTCNVASERNIQRDVSYFKTSSPGDSTKGIVSSSSEPIKVMLFFPEPNEVKEQVKDYFNALASATGKIQIEEHDRLLDAELAGKYKVNKDGYVVLVRGSGDKEKFGTIELDTELDKARKGAGKLRNFDREVNSQLMKLVREKRKAYLTVGHGEMTDYSSVPPELKNGKVPERHITTFKKRLTDLGYETKDLGLVDLAKDVPEDATVVIMLAPSVELQPAEWAALDRYLDKGGRLLVTLDPTGDPSLGPLEGKLGVKMAPGHLTDDQKFLPQRGNPSDRRFVITTQFSAHASTTALSRMSDSGLVLIDSGALEDAPLTVKDAKKTITIHSMESSWMDQGDPGNFAFDTGSEKRQKWNIGAAIEGPKVKGADGKDKDGYRAIVYADTDLFADVMVQNMGRVAVIMVSGPLLDDSIRWLGGEESFVGETVSEDDKAIEHTKGKDQAWFFLTVIGAPLVVLGLGLFGTLARRRRKPAAEVKS